MIDFLDQTLKSLFESRLPVTAEFDVPDHTWRGHVTSTGGNFLNIYLVEIRENRKLRSNEVVSTWVGTMRQQEMMPARLDCHYLISAWTPAGITPTPLIQASIIEDAILYDATRVLFDNIPLDVNALYPPGMAAPPDVMLEQALPAVVAPPEGFAKLPDFWMRMDWVWKPVLELIVTLPIVAVARPAGPPVTTLLAHYLQNGDTSSLEELITIGGVVRTVNSRSVADGVTTINSAAISSATANWTVNDIGRVVASANLPANTVISSVQSATAVILNAKAIATGVGQTFVISRATSIANAWVRLVELDQMVRSNAAGQFILSPVTRGQYHLESGAPGHPMVSRVVDVPSLSGEYDLVLP